MITPAKQHYRRTHSPVPVVDPATYRLSVGIEGQKPKLYSLEGRSGSELLTRSTHLRGGKGGGANHLKRETSASYFVFPPGNI